MSKKIKLDKIHTNINNPYKFRDDEMEALMESIKEYGIIQPLLVRKEENDTYEIISGHRRFLAATRLELKDVPVDVLEISKDEADILLVDSNLHRENISISEKAFAYKLKFEALKNQGKRTDLTSVQVAPKLATEQIADDAGTSKDTIKRYIRLTNLSPELLRLVDDGKIAFTVAYNLSYLTKEQQSNLYETIQSEDCTPSLAQAINLRKLAIDNNLDMDSIFNVMTKPKANQKEMFKMPMEKMRKLAPYAETNKEVEDYITKACEYYARYLQRQRDRGDR